MYENRAAPKKSTDGTAPYFLIWKDLVINKLKNRI